MILQIGLQGRMVLYPFLVVRQRRVLAELFRNFAMVIKELVEACQLAMSCVAVARGLSTVTVVFALVIAVFGVHEGARIGAQLLSNRWMFLQVGLQLRMGLQKLSITHQRRVLAQLLTDFAMAVEELVKAGQLASQSLAITVG